MILWIGESLVVRSNSACWALWTWVFAVIACWFHTASQSRFAQNHISPFSFFSLYIFFTIFYLVFDNLLWFLPLTFTFTLSVTCTFTWISTSGQSMCRESVSRIRWSAPPAMEQQLWQIQCCSWSIRRGVSFVQGGSSGIFGGEISWKTWFGDPWVVVDDEWYLLVTFSWRESVLFGRSPSSSERPNVFIHVRQLPTFPVLHRATIRIILHSGRLYRGRICWRAELVHERQSFEWVWNERRWSRSSPRRVLSVAVTMPQRKRAPSSRRRSVLATRTTEEIGDAWRSAGRSPCQQVDTPATRFLRRKEKLYKLENIGWCRDWPWRAFLLTCPNVKKLQKKNMKRNASKKWEKSRQKKIETKSKESKTQIKKKKTSKKWNFTKQIEWKNQSINNSFAWRGTALRVDFVAECAIYADHSSRRRRGIRVCEKLVSNST